MSKLDRLTDTIKQCSIAVHEGREVQLRYRQRWSIGAGARYLKITGRDGMTFHVHKGRIYMGPAGYAGSGVYLDISLPGWGITVSDLDLMEVRRRMRSLVQTARATS